MCSPRVENAVEFESRRCSVSMPHAKALVARSGGCLSGAVTPLVGSFRGAGRDVVLMGQETLMQRRSPDRRYARPPVACRRLSSHARTLTRSTMSATRIAAEECPSSASLRRVSCSASMPPGGGNPDKSTARP